MPISLKRAVAAAAALVLPLSLLGTVPASAAPITLSDWTELQSAFAAPAVNEVIALGADITAPDDESLLMDAESELTLDLNGYTLTIGPAAHGMAAVGVPLGAELTVEATGGGALYATGGFMAAGIGGGDRESVGATTISGGTIIAAGGSGGAGIGGGNGRPQGETTITGGNITASGGSNAAGIGGGVGGSGGTTTISGGSVTATGGFRGAGIGGGNVGIGGVGVGHGGTTAITGGTVIAVGGDYGSGIGGGSGGNGGITVIDGGVVTASSPINGAGIGGGLDGLGGSTTITNGTVSTTGGRYAAGIGGGYRGSGLTTTISGGTVSATGGEAAAGIGGGLFGTGGAATISGGTVTASGDRIAAGIGGGGSIGGYAGFEGTLGVSGTAESGSATTGGGIHGSPITHPTQPAGLSYRATVELDAQRSTFTLGFLYRVEFDALGGSAVTASSVPVGSPALEPTAPTKFGFTFAGWTLADVPYDFSLPVTEPITLTATWAPAPQFTVTFDTVGGSSVAAQDVYDGSAVTEPAAPVLDGHTFAGWRLNDAPYDFSTPVTAPITLRASWSLLVYTVVFNSAGGSAIAPQDIAHGGLVTEPASPTRPGHTFAGWRANGTPYDFSTPVTAPLTLRATWAVVPPTEPTTHRVFGPDRYSTAVEVSKRTFDNGSSTVFIATGTGFADALGAAPAAARESAPLLLTPQSSLPTVVAEEILRLKANKVVIVGGTGAVSAAVENAIRALSTAPRVERISGTDRYATSRAIVERYFQNADNAFIATGLNFPDALAAGPAAAALTAPVLLVPGSQPTLDGPTLAALHSLRVTTAYVVGGTGVVSQGIENQLNALAGVSAVRLSGSDRYSTAVAVNDAVFDATTHTYLATGLSFADTLAAGAAAANQGAPLYITPPSCIPPGVHASIRSREPAFIYVLGGTSILSNNVENLVVC